MKRPVALDVMGGDYGPDVLVAGAVAAVNDGHAVVLVGDRDRIEDYTTPREAILRARRSCCRDGRCPQYRATAPDTSVRVAARLVRSGQAGAAVSCGNTGASMVAAMMEMGVLPGIGRPPVSVVLPRSDGGRLVLLDAGANVDCRPEMLAKFGILGAAYARSWVWSIRGWPVVQ